MSETSTIARHSLIRGTKWRDKYFVFEEETIPRLEETINEQLDQAGPGITMLLGGVTVVKGAAGDRYAQAVLWRRLTPGYQHRLVALGKNHARHLEEPDVTGLTTDEEKDAYLAGWHNED